MKHNLKLNRNTNFILKMASFKKLNTKIYQKKGPVITPDFIYWKKLEAPVLVKEFGAIDYIDFSPIEPYYFAVTCSVRVQVYNPITKLVTKNLSRFRESAYGAVFRDDGRLICAGGEEACVKLFDVSTKSLLRLFKGHEAPIHRTFFLNNKPQISSFSDDKTVKIWDIPTEKNVITFSGHTDYVRAGAVSPVAPDILVSGGYDNIVKMYDTRTQNEVLSLKHGSPIESVIFLPSGGIVLSAGGTEIKIWDTIAGGKLLGSVSHHHKTITCLRLASNNKRLLSGSLDKHVKIYDISTFKVVHTLDYPSSILSLGVSKDDDTVAVGMTDGLVAISRRKEEEAKNIEKKRASARQTTNIHKVDLIVPEYKPEQKAKFDNALQKFKFSKALDLALLPYVANKQPEVTVSVVQELIRRRALDKALQGRDVKSITHFLKFLIKNLAKTQFTKILIDASNIFLDTYEESPIVSNPEVKNLLIILVQLLSEELNLAAELASLQGAMHLLLSASSVAQEPVKDRGQFEKLQPSADALRNLVVEL